MVEWRDRGFVQDSDEEDEAEISGEDSQDKRSDSHTPFAKAATGLREGETKHNEKIEVAVVINCSGGRRNAKNGIRGGEREDEKTPGARGPPLENGPVDHKTETKYLDGPSSNTGAEDLDELQADTVRAKPTTSKTTRNIKISKSLQSVPKTPKQQNLSSGYDIFDIPSSPLSEAPPSPIPALHEWQNPSPRLAPPRTRASPSSIVDPARLRNFSSVSPIESRRNSPEHIPSPPHEPTWLEQAIPYSPSHEQRDSRRRTFRPRNPIQLHPYLLENEQYRNTLRARGVRPVVVAEAIAEQTQHEEPESQDIVDPGRSSPFEPSSPSNLDSSPLMLPIGLGGLNHNLEAHKPGTSSPSYELNSAARVPARVSRASDQLEGTTTEPERLRRELALSPFALPLLDASEPTTSRSSNLITTGRVTKKYRLKKFKMPAGFIKPHLPTPDTSSEPGAHALEVLDSPTSLESDRAAHPPDEPFASDAETARVESEKSNRPTIRSPSPCDSSSGSDEAEHIRVAQRRIRGVLPASYMTLNQRAQVEASKKSKRKTSLPGVASKNVSARGVARRVDAIAPQTGFGSAPSYVDLETSGESDSRQAGHSPRRQGLLPTKPQFRMPGHSRLETEIQEVVEDDWIDPMTSTVSRKRLKATGYTTQRKIREAFQKPTTTLYNDARRDLLMSDDVAELTHSINHKRHRTDRARRKYQLKLSVIDSQSFSLPGPRPDFLKVALRQARSRADGGRHRPSGKILFLHDRHDEAEMRATLDGWVTGRLLTEDRDQSAPKRSGLQREPFAEISYNHQQMLPEPLKSADVLRPAPVHSREDRLTSKTREPRLRQSRLNVTRRSHEEVFSANTLHGNNTRKHQVQAKEIRHAEQRDSRPGQLEDLELEHDNQHLDIAFRRDLFTLESAFDKEHTNPLLNKFLYKGNDGMAKKISSAQRGRPETKRTQDLPKDTHQQANIRRRIWKRRPQRTNVDDFDIDIPSSLDIPLSCSVSSLTNRDAASPRQTLQGLGKFGTFYTPDFGIKRLPTGTYFHHSTFIGSGEFQAILAFSQRDLDQPGPVTIFTLGETHFRWGGWTEEISTQFDDVFRYIQHGVVSMSPADTSRELVCAAQSSLTLSSTLRSVLRYLNDSLHFLDAVDRTSFLETVLRNVEELCKSLRMTCEGARKTQRAEAHFFKSAVLRLSTYSAVILYQLVHIAGSPIIQPGIKTHVESVLRSGVLFLAEILLQDNLQELWAVSFATQQHLIQQSGFKNENVEAEGIVVLSHVLPALHVAHLDFWNAFDSAFAKRMLTKYIHVAEFEKTWRDIFSMLPLLTFETSGVLGFRSMSEFAEGRWTVVKAMLCRLFELYPSTSGGSESTINSYIRANLSRCFILVRNWGWSNVEPILNCIFDFFARNGLSLLRHEESKGSPAFLLNLENTHSISLEPSDRSFDIFLKLLYVGLKQLSGLHPPRKMKSIAWRFIPNGGQILEKERELSHHDLNTKRNHHDLLVTLYSALPSSSRPRIDLIKNLVDFVSSHSEICRINLRSWANLVRFQLSTDEIGDVMDSFAMWFNKFLAEMLLQHQNARSEAESQFQASKAKGQILSNDLLESTIASNQKQTESLLIMALASLRECIEKGNMIESILALFNAILITPILEMFNPRLTRFNAVVIKALEVYDIVLERLNQPSCSSELVQTSEDSQDFGDLIALEDVIDELTTKTVHTIDEKTCISVQTLLSNCFGAELFIDDVLLMKLTETWLRICHNLVQSGQRDWSYYLDQHSPGSWQQLRSTDHSRKFYSYFMASILDLDETIQIEHAETFISAWMASLGERESMLKFQDCLTTSLLNRWPHHPLLQNLPFESTPHTKVTRVTMNQLRESRLGLLSSILSNMRQSFENALVGSTRETQQLRIEYTSIIRRFMNVLKNNYQETQQGSSTRGAYVEFVQKNVEFLQQYTNDICPIDPFFTDSAAFPLPVSDPAYVVGRLKSYTFNLSNIRTQKKLVIFIQSLCERAVVENQQEYLVGQLKMAVEGSHEQGLKAAPSLRILLMQVVLPVYLESVSTSECGWILANVLLDAAEHIFDEIMFEFSIADTASREVTTAMITDAIVMGCHLACSVSADFSLLAVPHFLHTLNSVYRAVTHVASVVDYIHRYSNEAGEAVRSIALMADMGNLVLEQLGTRGQAMSAHDRPPTSVPTSAFADLKAFCKRELEASLNKNWVKHENNYYVLRGNSRREVLIDVGTVDEEKSDMAEGIAEFLRVVGRMPTFTGIVQPPRAPVQMFTSGFVL